MFRIDGLGDAMSFKTAYRLAGYDEFEVVAGEKVVSVAKSFVEYTNLNKKSFVEINGCFFFSDENLDAEDIVKFVCGKSSSELDDDERKWIEEYDRKQMEFEKSIPSLENRYIEKGRTIIAPEYFDAWKKYVHVRLRDIYHGFELDCVLKLIGLLNDNAPFEIVSKALNNQGHSGRSHCIVMEMLCHLGGKDFADWIARNR